MRNSFLLMILGLMLSVGSKVYGQMPGVYFGEFVTDGKNLIVVVDESDEKNKGVSTALQEVMVTEWKLTPVEIISLAQFLKEPDRYINDEKNIFMTFDYYGVKAVVGLAVVGNKLYNREMLLGVAIKENGKVVKSKTIAYLMSFPEDLNSDLKAGFTKDLAVMKKILAGQKTAKERINPDPVIKTKTLYINKLQLQNRTEEDVKKNYPYPFKVVEPAEYASAILEKNPDIAFFEYIRADNMPSIFVFTMDEGSPLLWLQNARGVNNYVHYNFDILAKKLKK